MMFDERSRRFYRLIETKNILWHQSIDAIHTDFRVGFQFDHIATDEALGRLDIDRERTQWDDLPSAVPRSDDAIPDPA